MRDDFEHLRASVAPAHVHCADLLHTQHPGDANSARRRAPRRGPGKHQRHQHRATAPGHPGTAAAAAPGGPAPRRTAAAPAAAAAATTNPRAAARGSDHVDQPEC